MLIAAFLENEKAGDEVDKMDWIKMITAAVSGFFSWMVDGFGVPFTILFLMMVGDYISGLLVGLKNKDLSSRTGIIGIIKKVYIIILLMSIKGLDMAVLNTNGFIYDGAAVAFIVNEFISITENGGKLGVWLPEPVKKVIRVLKEKDQKEGDRSA